MLKERQKSILGATVREYVHTARPVASRDIVQKFRLGISPATVRNEMLSLDELGYLEQPHISAGRIPTDRGYRFFADNLAENYRISKRDSALIESLFKITDEEEFVRHASRSIARLSNTFTALGLLEDNTFYEFGLSEVLEEPEFQTVESVKMFGRLVDDWEDEIRDFFKNFEAKEAEQIFIGEENPFVEAKSCAVFISHWEHPQGFGGFITLVGPKRTDYARHKALLKMIHDYGKRRRKS